MKFEKYIKERMKLPICPLFEGGKCPASGDEYIDLEISWIEAEEINRECCENHRSPTIKELEEIDKKRKGDKKKC